MGKTEFTSWSKEDLIAYIDKLENTIKEANTDFLTNFKWAGNLGQWFWYYPENKVVFNDLKVLSLGYKPQQIGPVGFEFFTSKIHPDDYERVMDNMRAHLSGETAAYEVEYRIQHKNGHFIWYYDRGVVLSRDENGRPLMLQGIVFDISQAKKAEEKLKNFAERDELTNAYNRRMLYQNLQKNIDIFLEKQIPFSLIMLDVDYFKRVNDKYGHLIGDNTLIEIVKIIDAEKRSNDFLYRYGGEEFFVLVPNTVLESAKKFAERLHKVIQEHEFPFVKKITVSMGIVEIAENESVDAILKRADDLMYEAKRSGRNKIRG